MSRRGSPDRSRSPHRRDQGLEGSEDRNKELWDFFTYEAEVVTKEDILAETIKVLETEGEIVHQVRGVLSEPTARWDVHARAVRSLRADEHLNAECNTIWRGCSDEEQEELAGLYDAIHEPDPAVLAKLARRHLVKQVEGRYQPFSRLFAEFVRRRAVESYSTASLWVDVRSGDVLVVLAGSYLACSCS